MHVQPAQSACTLASETELLTQNMMMVLPTTIAFGDEGVPDTFKPTAHVFYGSRVLVSPVIP